MGLFLVAARNILRNKFRTVFTLLGAAVAILTFIMLQTVLSAWEAAAQHAAQDRIATRHKVSFIMSLPRRYADTVKETPGVKAVSWAAWFGAKDPNHPDEFFGSMAVDPKTFLEVYDEVSLPAPDIEGWMSDKQGAIIGNTLAKKWGLKVGDKLTLTGTIYPGDWVFNIRGIYTPTRKSFDGSQLMFHYDYLNDTLPERRKDQIGWIVARIDDASKSADIQAQIDKVFDEKDVQTATMSERAMNLSFLGMLSAILSALKIVSLIIILIMMMILGNTIAMGVRERTNEYGVLRALGFLPRQIGTLVLGEAFVSGTLAGVLGVALAYPIVQELLGRWLEENMGAFFPYFRIEPQIAIAAIALSSVLGVVAAIIPAYRAMKLNVTDALRRVA